MRRADYVYPQLVRPSPPDRRRPDPVRAAVWFCAGAATTLALLLVAGVVP